MNIISLLAFACIWLKKISCLPTLYLENCYTVAFVFKPNNMEKINIHESKWFNKLQAKINTNKTILSIVK